MSSQASASDALISNFTMQKRLGNSVKIAINEVVILTRTLISVFVDGTHWNFKDFNASQPRWQEKYSDDLVCNYQKEHVV